MTLTELKYAVAVAQYRHFGRASEACGVSQPTLSVSVKKLEENLGVALFERGTTEVSLTEIGIRIIAQAQKTLQEADHIKTMALGAQDPLIGALRVGVIYTIAPYVLPRLIPAMIQNQPTMPLILQENFTHLLLPMLRNGEIDAAILALPLPASFSDFASMQLNSVALYDEPFKVAVPKNHAWASRKRVTATELSSEHTLLLGSGHCFRDHVLGVCPEVTSQFEGTSLETLRHMVAGGLGITVLPESSLENVQGKPSKNDLLRYIPFDAPVPQRRVILVWRKSFTRLAAIELLRNTIVNCEIYGIIPLKLESLHKEHISC